jgi:hypothetical protein
LGVPLFLSTAWQVNEFSVLAGPEELTCRHQQTRKLGSEGHLPWNEVKVLPYVNDQHCAAGPAMIRYVDRILSSHDYEPHSAATLTDRVLSIDTAIYNARDLFI